jgi:glycosyltransferase involved in cell wall biosynthesis
MSNDCPSIYTNLHPKTGPLITVITVVFNGAEFLEETIRSVRSQSYKNIEYIVIDGGSTDGSLAIIQKYEKHINYWVSEKDSGIYDAMNKGVSLATGQWINFMNSGDRFLSNYSVKTILANDNLNHDILIGNTTVDYGGFHKINRVGDLRQLWKGMQFCHQSVIVKSLFLKNNPFSVDSPIAADFEFFLLLLNNPNVNAKVVNVTIAMVSIGGVSDTKRVDTLIAWRNSVLRYRPHAFVKPYYFVYISYTRFKMFLKRALPKKFIHKIIQIFS